MTSEAGGVGEIAVEIRVLVEVFKEITDLPCRPEFSAQTLDDVVDGAVELAALRLTPWPRIGRVIPVEGRVIQRDEAGQLPAEALADREPVQVDGIVRLIVFLRRGPQRSARSGVEEETGGRHLVSLVFLWRPASRSMQQGRSTTIRVSGTIRLPCLQIWNSAIRPDKAG